MQFERDMLQTIVMPELNDFARTYGESIHFVDLRWGVNTEDLESEEGSRKVLSVCLDQIDNCKPYMIVLLGERYGWIPSEELLKSATERKQYNLNDLNKSVTALEIEYGALSESNISSHRCFFYFREALSHEDMNEQQKRIYSPESEEHIKKLMTLKNKIKDKLGDKVRYYSVQFDAQKGKISGLDALAAMICQDVKGLMENEFGKMKELTWQQREMIDSNLFIEDKCRYFSARQNLIDKYETTILLNSTKLLILRGEAGSGKSTIMCKLAKQLESKSYKVFPFISGKSSKSSTTRDLLMQLEFYLEEQLKITNHFEDTGKGKEATAFVDWRNRFTKLINEFEKTSATTLVILVDALDQLIQDEATQNFMWLPEKLPSNVKIAVSCLNSFKLPVILPYGSETIIEQLGELNSDEKYEVINSILRNEGKELSKDVIYAISQKSQSHNPLYLSIILQRIIMLDSKDFGEIAERGDDITAINEYILYLIENSPPDVNGMCAAILNEAGQRVNKELINMAMYLLATSRQGLRESDIMGICTQNNFEYNSLDLARLIKYMRPFFFEREDGRIDFTHRTIRDGFLSEADKEFSYYNSLILEWLKTLDKNDTLKMDEIIYHAFRSEDKLCVIDTIYSYQFKDKLANMIVWKEIRDMCLLDNGQFLIDIINYDEVFDNKEYFYKFFKGDFDSRAKLINYCNDELYKYFGKSMHEIDILLEIEKALLVLSERLVGRDNTIRTNDYAYKCSVNVGDLLVIQGKIQEAMNYYEKVLKISEILAKLLGKTDNSRHIFTGNIKVADMLSVNGRKQEAFKLYKTSALIAQKIADGSNNPLSRDLWTANQKIADTLMSQEKTNEALKIFEEGLETAQKLADISQTLNAQRDLFISILKVGDALEALKRYDEATVLYERNIVIAQKLSDELKTPAAYRDLWLSNIKVAGILKIRRKYEEALKIYLSNLELSKNLAEQLQTPQAKDDLAISNINVALLCRSEDKKLYIEPALKIWQQLYEQTSLPRYLKNLQYYKQELSKYL